MFFTIWQLPVAGRWWWKVHSHKVYLPYFVVALRAHSERCVCSSVLFVGCGFKVSTLSAPIIHSIHLLQNNIGVVILSALNVCVCVLFGFSSIFALYFCSVVCYYSGPLPKMDRTIASTPLRFLIPQNVLSTIRIFTYFISSCVFMLLFDNRKNIKIKNQNQKIPHTRKFSFKLQKEIKLFQTCDSQQMDNFECIYDK